MFFAMIALAMMALSVFLLLWRETAKARVLQARLEDALGRVFLAEKKSSALHHEITESRRIEKALGEAYDRYLRYFESSSGRSSA